MRINDKLLRQILSEQKKTNDILVALSMKGIQISGRTWRTFVREYNNEYANHDRYIASNNQGYYLTTNKKKIAGSVVNRLKCGLSTINNAKKDFRALSEKDQLSIFKTDPDMYDILLKMEE